MATHNSVLCKMIDYIEGEPLETRCKALRQRWLGRTLEPIPTSRAELFDFRDAVRELTQSVAVKSEHKRKLVEWFQEAAFPAKDVGECQWSISWGPLSFEDLALVSATPVRTSKGQVICQKLHNSVDDFSKRLLLAWSGFNPEITRFAPASAYREVLKSIIVNMFLVPIRRKEQGSGKSIYCDYRGRNRSHPFLDHVEGLKNIMFKVLDEFPVEEIDFRIALQPELLRLSAVLGQEGWECTDKIIQYPLQLLSVIEKMNDRQKKNYGVVSRKMKIKKDTGVWYDISLAKKENFCIAKYLGLDPSPLIDGYENVDGGNISCSSDEDDYVVHCRKQEEALYQELF